jgi:hypothetical protein
MSRIKILGASGGFWCHPARLFDTADSITS